MTGLLLLTKEVDDITEGCADKLLAVATLFDCRATLAVHGWLIGNCCCKVPTKDKLPTFGKKISCWMSPCVVDLTILAVVKYPQKIRYRLVDVECVYLDSGVREMHLYFP